MKKQWIILCIVAGLLTSATPIFISGCTSTHQQIAVQTLDGLEEGVTASYKSYIDLAMQGKVKTNSVPIVSKRYNEFQLHWLLALDLVQNNTNALAPSALVLEGEDLINVIGYKKLQPQ